MTAGPGTVPLIRAGGGLVTRARKGTREFLLVHRPRYDDWSLPKGKLENGESFSAAAVREVAEETGSRTRKLARLGSISYTTNGNRPKVVRYWLFEHTGGKFKPNPEVDEVRWLSAGEAQAMISYRRDRNVFAWGAHLAEEPDAGRVHLVRHGKAGSRSGWKDEDHLRPLTRPGVSQATRLANELAAAPISRVLSSYFERCRQTVEPLAAVLDERIRDEASLAEGAKTDILLETINRLSGTTSVLCSHGAEISRLLSAIEGAGVRLPDEPATTPKGAIWDLDVRGGEVVAAQYRGLPG